MTVKQTTNGKTAHITDTVIRLETLKSSLPEGTISDYSTKQRLLDAMDVRLRREVKPHITSETTFEQLVEIAEKRDAIARSTGVYGNKDRSSNAVSNAVSQPKSRNSQNNNQGQNPRFSNNTTQYPRITQAEKDRRRREGACYYCGKQGHFTNNCLEKKYKQRSNNAYNQRGNGGPGGIRRFNNR
jgi:hypothetical protein